MENKLSEAQLSWLVILRIFIGWHFLYEGLVKLLNPNWTAATYLMDSKGWFGPLFVRMAGNPGLMNVVDFLNQWALVLIGAGLLLGIFSRLSSIGGMILLLLYTLSHPALIGVKYQMSFEGSYLIIDKNLIELVALGVSFVFPTARLIGIDRFFTRVLPVSCQKFII
jgi:thiosulfate dehydrogenase [quinone] large subunit